MGSAPPWSSPPVQGWPRWLDEIDLTLPVSSHFVLYGNVRDTQLIPSDDGPVAVPLIQSLWERLRHRDFRFFVIYDRGEGVRVHPKELTAQAAAVLGLSWLRPEAREDGSKSVTRPCAPSQLPDLVRAVASVGGTRCALIVDNASRLILASDRLSDDELAIFTACERDARTATPKRPPGTPGQPLFNPVFWLATRVRDLPDWFIVGNERLRTISVPLPDFETREAVAHRLSPSFAPDGDRAGPEIRKLTGQFAALTERLTLRAMHAVAQLARDQGLPLTRVGDAIRCYKIGVPDDPWRQPHLRDRIRGGAAEIRTWVKGQDAAVVKTLDILTRSVMGLSGAQASSAANRPRGVLFFAGPTGVGKTELAKAVTRLVFGDPEACIRFDMSEFSAEHSDARLIGAPPGYVGYDAGGELVNAVRQRPFSVLLFDEVEKAHPRILDKFLQVLEDGRLTDARGDTVHFSETVIIFTSNLGVYRENERGDRVLNVSAEAPYAEVERQIRGAIEGFFRFDLQRPELLNRIGDNIIVFDFIRPPVARQIFEKALGNIVARVRDGQSVDLRLGPGVPDRLLELCTTDLANGGRGIGNRLETCLINPLARALFDLGPCPGSVVSVERLVEAGEAGFEVGLSCASA